MEPSPYFFLICSLVILSASSLEASEGIFALLAVRAMGELRSSSTYARYAHMVIEHMYGVNKRAFDHRDLTLQCVQPGHPPPESEQNTSETGANTEQNTSETRIPDYERASRSASSACVTARARTSSRESPTRVVKLVHALGVAMP